MTRKITTIRPTFSALCGLTLLNALIILPAASTSAIVVTSMVGTESLVTDADGTNTANISNANGASFSSLINIAGSAGNGPNGTSNTDDPYDASRYYPQYIDEGGSAVSFSSGGVDVSIAYAGPGERPEDEMSVQGPIAFNLTFNYGPITDTITSARFSIDITDDDYNLLTFTTENGQNIGSTNTQGNTSGAPSGYWYAIDEGGNIDTTLTIALDADELTDLASGQYTLNGEWTVGPGSDNLNGLFASNRAKLEIEAIPEPSSMALLTGALAACVLLYRRRN